MNILSSCLEIPLEEFNNIISTINTPGAEEQGGVEEQKILKKKKKVIEQQELKETYKKKNISEMKDLSLSICQLPYLSYQHYNKEKPQVLFWTQFSQLSERATAWCHYQTLL